MLFFQKFIVVTFILGWSSKPKYLVDSLLCLPHLYIPPLLGFLRELSVKEGLVSPSYIDGHL